MADLGDGVLRLDSGIIASDVSRMVFLALAVRERTWSTDCWFYWLPRCMMDALG